MDPLRASGERAAQDPLLHTRLTRPQLEFVSSKERMLAWVGGNTIGKSFAQSWDAIHTCRGTHPYRATHRSPIRMLMVGYSFAQMDPLLEKLWRLLPKDEIDPKVRYIPKQGFRGFKEPVIPFVRGPGKGSVIGFATYEQGADRIMGDQVHDLRLDEPPPESILGECIPRLNAYRGTLRVTFTPTPESPPLGYFKERIKAGKIAKMQTSYTLDACTLLGGLIPIPMRTQAQIDEDLSNYLDDERPMREHGEMDILVGTRWLSKIGESCTIELLEIPAGKRWRIAVGIDHGSRPGRQVATLVITDGETVILLDEVRTDDVTSPREDARGILLMLRKWGMRWSDVDIWRGDRRTTRDFWGVMKSNQDLVAGFADELQVTKQHLVSYGLRIRVPSKFEGSVRRGVRIINGLAKSGKFKVNRACEGFLQGAREWSGAPEDPLKDAIDSGRYAVEGLLDAEFVIPPTGRID